MKNLVLFTLALMLLCGKASAQTVTVADVDALPGEKVSFVLNLHGGKADTYTSLQFDATFPEGFATTGNYTISSLWPNASATVGDVIDGYATIPVSSADEITRTDVEGLLSVEFKVAENVALGDYDVTLSKITFGYGFVDKDIAPDVTFRVHVANTVVLDENATTPPKARENVGVRVKRTIKANEWSTICLPFAMTEAQCKEAFGDDVELADFTSYDIEQNEAKETVGITVNFADVTAIEANHPYIIKVGADISEFSVDGVTIAPDEEGAYTQFDNGETGRKQVIYGWFVGTYHADTTVPADCLFLSDNNFWYSAGQTKMKAFRAYFELNDKLTHPADDTQADSRLRLHIIPGETTGIAEKSSAVRLGHTATYDLQGRRVTSPRGKGLYISEGRKIIVK